MLWEHGCISTVELGLIELSWMGLAVTCVVLCDGSIIDRVVNHLSVASVLNSIACDFLLMFVGHIGGV